MDTYQPISYLKRTLQKIRRGEFSQIIKDEYNLEDFNTSEQTFSFLFVDERGNTNKCTKPIIDFLRPEFEKSLQYYRNGINNLIDEKKGDTESFVKVQQIILQGIESDFGREIALYHPFIESYLQKFEEHLIASTSGSYNKKSVKFKSRKEKVDVILKYLNDDILPPERLLSPKDFRKLVNWVYHLVEKEEVPHINEPIKEIKVTNEIIRFTFYVIHKEVFTTKHYKPCFFEFLQKAFTSFEDVSKPTIRKKFSTSSNINKKDKIYLPKIILENMKK